MKRGKYVRPFRLTLRDMDVCCALTRVWLRTGRATVREVAAEVGLSLAPTQKHLRKLRRAGLICTGRGSLRPGSVS